MRQETTLKQHHACIVNKNSKSEQPTADWQVVQSAVARSQIRIFLFPYVNSSLARVFFVREVDGSGKIDRFMNRSIKII